ncbi:MAG: hypothetical protein JSR33_11025, partial [Proteobacteria bacterium]|nr:hypothetical protein [Pseudomonadota bacterium]
MFEQHDHCIFSIYPLSPSFFEKITNLIGQPPSLILLSELHNGSLLKLFKKLRSLKIKNLWLPIEYPNVQLFIPILKLLSLPIKIHQIRLVTPD